MKLQLKNLRQRKIVPPPPSENKVKEIAMEKKESKKDIVERLVKQGMSNKEIADQTGIAYQTVWKYARDLREKIEACVGQNTDRHKCKSCQYRLIDHWKQKLHGECDYIGSVGKRPCKVEDCYVYQKGEPLRARGDEEETRLANDLIVNARRELPERYTSE